MYPRRWLPILVLFLGCSNSYQSEALRLRYQPPRNAKVEFDSPGPPAMARFSRGIELRSLTLTTPPLDEEHLDQLRDVVVKGAELGELGNLLSARLGTIPAGPVARFEFKRGSQRTLLYVLPRPNRVVLATMSDEEAAYGLGEARFERSMSTLSPLD